MERPLLHAVLLHGAGAHPRSHWLAWLYDQLADLTIRVSAPWFPTPEGQHLDTWRAMFADEVGALEQNTLLIAHDVGVAFALHLLETAPEPITGLIGVAGYYKPLGIPQFDVFGESFLTGQLQWGRIRKNAGRIALLHGRSDPYVSQEHAAEMGKHLSHAPEVVDDAGHFDEESSPEIVQPVIWRVVSGYLGA